MDRLKWENDTDIFDRNFILFLDEIEVHLHPAWQRKILPVVQKLFKNSQIFISTHSPFVVGSVDGAWVHKLKKDGAYAVLDGEPILSEDAESYDTILEEVFGIKERFGIEIENKLVDFRKYTREILKGDNSNFHKWEETIEFFKNQRRPQEIMSLISPQIRQIHRILKQEPA
ncbi:MAG: AAA family ATPase [Arcicella sp.]|nr:AAA family ATPase [Arcicella sp.]